MKPARQYQPQDSVTVGLLAFWHPQPVTTNVESCDKKVGTRARGSEPGRLGTNRSMLANRVHAATVLGDRSNSYQRGRVTTPTGPMESRKSTRDLKRQSAGKEHTNEVRDGGRDPGVRRPGPGLSQSPASS